MKQFIIFFMIWTLLILLTLPIGIEVKAPTRYNITQSIDKFTPLVVSKEDVKSDAPLFLFSSEVEVSPSPKVPDHLNPDWVAPCGLTNREMLAIVIYQEAGGNKSCDDCRRRVGDVVLNRVESSRFKYADSIDDVLLRPKQYGRLAWTGIKWPKRASYPNEAKAVERAYRIADEIFAGQHSDVYQKGYVWQAEFIQGKQGFWCCGTYFGK